jgi:hypothetical protein
MIQTGENFTFKTLEDIDTVDKWFSFLTFSLEEDCCYLNDYYIPRSFDYLGFFKYLLDEEKISKSLYNNIIDRIEVLWKNSWETISKEYEKSNFLEDEQYFGFAVGFAAEDFKQIDNHFFEADIYFEKTFGFSYLMLEYVLKTNNKKCLVELFEDILDAIPQNLYKDDDSIDVPYFQKPNTNIFELTIKDSTIIDIENSLKECLEFVDEGDFLRDLLLNSLNLLVKV